MDQITKAMENKRKAEARIIFALAPWVKEIVANYRIGDRTITSAAMPMLTEILKRQYIRTVNQVLGIDIREWKQEQPDETYRRLSVVLTDKLSNRLPSTVTSITDTADKFAERASMYAISEQLTEAEADAVIGNYLRTHRLTIAITEAQWLVETTRNTAVVEVMDPLGNSVQQIADLIDRGDYNAARKLSRQVMKLTRLPLSEGQGTVLNYVNDIRDKLMTPEVQGEIVSNLRRRAAELGAEEKMWLTLGDGKVRESHVQANGQKRPITEPFNVGGYKLQYPGDASLGASLSEIINCVPGNTYVSSLSKIHKIYKRYYSGEIIKLSTSSGMNISVTPNHPILTNSGWKIARNITKSDKLAFSVGVKAGKFSNPNKYTMPSMIEQIFNFASMVRKPHRVGGANAQFHGDGKNGYVDIIFIDSFLKNWIKTVFFEKIRNFFFTITNFCKMVLVTDGPIYKYFMRPLFPAYGCMCRIRKTTSFFLGSICHALVHCFASISPSESDFNKPGINSAPINTNDFRNFLNGFPFVVEFDEVVDINVCSFCGHVYNLETKDNYYLAIDDAKHNGKVNQIIIHNCRCVTRYGKKAA